MTYESYYLLLDPIRKPRIVDTITNPISHLYEPTFFSLAISLLDTTDIKDIELGVESLNFT